MHSEFYCMEKHYHEIKCNGLCKLMNARVATLISIGQIRLHAMSSRLLCLLIISQLLLDVVFVVM